MITNFTLLQTPIKLVGTAALAVGQMLPAGPPGPVGPAGASGVNTNPVFGTKTISATTYTVLATDGNGVLQFILAPSCLVTLPTFGAGWWVWFNNNLGGIITITPSGGAQIDGQASNTLDAGCSALVYSSGSTFENLVVTDGGRY